MRVGTVIGRVTLSQAVPAVLGARWLVVRPWTRERFANPGAPLEATGPSPSLVVYDDLGGGVGQTIGFVEGREAASPFAQPTPIDAINAALIDALNYSPYSGEGRA